MQPSTRPQMQGRPSQALAGPPGWPDASAKASDDRGHGHGGTLPVIAPLFSYFTQLLGLSSLLPGRQLTRARSVGKGRSWAAGGRRRTLGRQPAGLPAARPPGWGSDSHRLCQQPPSSLSSFPTAGNREHSPAVPYLPATSAHIWGQGQAPLLTVLPVLRVCVRTHSGETEQGETQRWNPCPNAFGKKANRELSTQVSRLRFKSWPRC